MPDVIRLRRGWLSGLTVGAAAGFATLEIPSLGWLLVIAFAVPAVVVGPRVAAIGGLLAGIGGIWMAILGRVALTCTARDGEIGCQAPGLQPWLTAGAAQIALGVLLTAIAVVRGRRAGAAHQS